MSYYATFKPTKEAMDELRDSYHRYDEDCLHQYKLNVINYCMSEQDNASFFAEYKAIKMALTILSNYIKMDEYNFAVDTYDKENGEISYCGWQFSQESCDITLKDATENALSTLVLVKNYTTPDMLDDDGHFLQKKCRIEECLDNFIEECRIIYIFDIMEKLKDYRVNDNEDMED